MYCMCYNLCWAQVILDPPENFFSPRYSDEFLLSATNVSVAMGWASETVQDSNR